MQFDAGRKVIAWIERGGWVGRVGPTQAKS